ncbi:hypothetical protein AHAS_Ahas20G0179100 [Arachis hypogaea]
MSRNRDKNILIEADPEPKRTLKRKLREAKAQSSGEDLTEIFEKEGDMAEPNNNGGDARKMLGDFIAPSSNFYGRSISIPAIGANNFELKPQLVSLMQQNCKFHGFSLEDPNQFLAEFLQICDTVKTNGVDPEVYRLMLFPLYFWKTKKNESQTHKTNRLNSWEKLVSAFLAKFFPPQKMSKLRVEIQTFRQKEGESLFEAWERYKQLIKMCPTDMLPEWSIICIFYDGLSELSKMSLDHSTRGSLHLKNPAKAQELIDMVANNQFMYTYERSPVNNGMPQKKGILEIDTLNAILAQNKILTQQVNIISQSLNGLQAASNRTKEASSEEEAYDPENPTMAEVNYMGEPYGNTYNLSWRNHPNFSWKDQQKPQQGFNNNGGRNRFSNSKPFPSSSQQQTENSEQSHSGLATIVSDLPKTTLSFMNETRSSIRNLEAWVGQLRKKITETPSSTLPSNTEENPKRECKAITMTNMAEPGESEEDVSPSEKSLMGRPLDRKEFPFEEPKESEAHTETIEIPLNFFL